MRRLTVIIMAIMLMIAPLLPQRAGANVVICANGGTQTVQMDSQGNKVPPCLPGEHCALCVVIPAISLPPLAQLSRPDAHACDVTAPRAAIFHAKLNRPAAFARGPPQPRL